MPIFLDPVPGTADDVGTITWAWLKKVYKWCKGESAIAPSTTAAATLAEYYDYPVDATAGSVTITLPSVINNPGKKYVIKKTDVSTNTVVVTAGSGDTIDGAATVTLSVQYQTLVLVSNGNTIWQAITGTAASFPAPGSNKQVIYNNAGTLAGDANFTWDSASTTLTVAGGSSSISAGNQVSAPIINASSYMVIGSNVIEPIARNWVMNGACEVAQRPVATLTTGQLYGSVDRFKVAVTAGTVSAGTITQDTTATVSSARAPYSLKVSGASLATTPTLSVYHYIEAKDAIHLKNATQLTFSVLLRHDVGSNITYTLQVDKANAVDNFAAATNISSTTQIVPTASNVRASLTFAPGDVSNGIRLLVSVPPGTTTTKNFYYTEWSLTTAITVPVYPWKPFHEELQACRRFYQKSFEYAVAPATNTGNNNGVILYYAALAGLNTESVFMPTSPHMRNSAGTYTYYNPGAANAKWRNLSVGADSGVAAVIGQGETGFTSTNPQVVGELVGAIMAVHYTIDADF